ncbi:MAG: hypothetical protein EA402_09255 [Planctomycetota bacterium]|nr:MAG: hypothetical protein EA402_09255 [Planctomycetota bacterium]
MALPPGSQPALRSPRLSGCLLGLIWLAMIPLTVLLYAAGINAILYGRASDEAALSNLGWWLIVAGAAATAILCSSLIMSMRLRRLLAEQGERPAEKQPSNEANED